MSACNPWAKGSSILANRSACFFKALLQIVMSNQQDTVLQDIKVIYVGGLRYISVEPQCFFQEKMLSTFKMV